MSTPRPPPENNATGSGQNRPSGTTKLAVPHIRFAPHISDVRHSLYFEAMDRDVPEGTSLKVGRFTDRVSQQPNRIAFRSKVVSRSHAEIWSENGQFYIRDTKSSSGTFLNHVRLSLAGTESVAKRLHDGDILQLGVDYQGGVQDIYKCVKIRLEINRAWQRQAENPYRQRVMKNLQNMFNSFNSGAEDRHECCICLYSMGPFQALFVAPCSHCFHFKCIKPIVFTTTGFCCPLCRTFADLEAPVEEYENELTTRSAEVAAVPATEDSSQRNGTATTDSAQANPNGSGAALVTNHPCSGGMTRNGESHHVSSGVVSAEPPSLPPIAIPATSLIGSPVAHDMDINIRSNGGNAYITPNRPPPFENNSTVSADRSLDATPVPLSTNSTAPHRYPLAASDEESTPAHSLNRDMVSQRTGINDTSLGHHPSPTSQVTSHFSNLAMGQTDNRGGGGGGRLVLPDDSGSDGAFLSEESITDPHHQPFNLAPSGNGVTPPATRNDVSPVVPFPPRVFPSNPGITPLSVVAPRVGDNQTSLPLTFPNSNIMIPDRSSSANILQPPRAHTPNHILHRTGSRRRSHSCAMDPSSTSHEPPPPDSPMTRTFAESNRVGLPEVDQRGESLRSSGMTASITSPASDAHLPQRPSMMRVSTGLPMSTTSSALSSDVTATVHPTSATTSTLAHSLGLSSSPSSLLRSFRRRLSDHTEYFQSDRVVQTTPLTGSFLASQTLLPSMLSHLRILAGVGHRQTDTAMASSLLNHSDELPTQEYAAGTEVINSTASASPQAIRIPPGISANCIDDGNPRSQRRASGPLLEHREEAVSPVSSMGEFSDPSGPNSSVCSVRDNPACFRVRETNVASWVTDDTEGDGTTGAMVSTTTNADSDEQRKARHANPIMSLSTSPNQCALAGDSPPAVVNPQRSERRS